jgi:hypothetical protein
MNKITKPKFSGTGKIRAANIETEEELAWVIREMRGQND